MIVLHFAILIELGNVLRFCAVIWENTVVLSDWIVAITK